MCRIALTSEGQQIVELLAKAQSFGGTLDPEYCSAGGCHVGINRFGVTSGKLQHGAFPIESDRFILAFNGEVYGLRNRSYVDETHFPSDGHFALELLHQSGVRAFLEEADIQGTFLIYDKELQEWWILADQMNTAGCFYANWQNKIIVASESAPVHSALKTLGINANEPIQVLAPGRALRRTSDGRVYEHLLRPQGRTLFKGKHADETAFGEAIEKLDSALTEGVRRRIPLSGPVGVLCSGGIDSSVILAITVQLLRDQNQLNRLKVFTLSTGDKGRDDLDETFVHMLFKSLELDTAQYLQIIPADDLTSIKKQLLQNHVFCDQPRLIPPNPLLRTQVRNAVMMSAFLYAVRKANPDVLTLLSGDGADEIFAGYPEMMLGKTTADEVREEIVHKVMQFPLNDGSRVALSAFYGATAAARLQNSDCQPCPVEIRMPFTSHVVLDSLSSAHPLFLFGEIDDQPVTKFLVRIIGAIKQIPFPILMREKMPFNEGATGFKNGVASSIECEVAEAWMKSKQLTFDSPEMKEIRSLFGMAEQKPNNSLVGNSDDNLFDQFALVLAAFSSGAQRLIRGTAFQDLKPAPTKQCKAYFPEEENLISLRS